MNKRTSFTVEKSEKVNSLRETIKKISKSKNKNFEETFITCLTIGCFEMLKEQSIESFKNKIKNEVK